MSRFNPSRRLWMLRIIMNLNNRIAVFMSAFCLARLFNWLYNKKLLSLNLFYYLMYAVFEKR